MSTELASLATADPATLDREEIFGQLPPNRVGAADRAYMEEVLSDGFGNRESADMNARFGTAFAERFGVPSYWGILLSLRRRWRPNSTDGRDVSSLPNRVAGLRWHAQRCLCR